MKRSFLMLSVLLMAAGLAFATNPATLKQAKNQAAREGKPILIEFVQPDCDFCQMAAHDFAANDTILNALISVVYLPLDVNSPEGERLSAAYYVQSDFPVFALTDSSGEIIDHWTGYNNPAFFVGALRRVLSAPITIKARYKMLQNAPTVDNAVFLAKYNTEIGDNLKSAELFRQAQDLKNGDIYVYDIFRSKADAVWKGNLQFEQLIPAADDVLVLKGNDITAIAGVARLIGNVARKTGNTSEIARYLKAGIDITSGRDDIRSREWHALFAGDWALYVDHDTAGATSIEKENLGAGWENNPGRFYSYARWCLERKINLDEAETYARQAVDRASEGKFKASILVTLSGIYEARGKISDAAGAMETAAQQDPDNSWYASEAKRLRDLASEKK
jgi:tetratricopeptide (TPR) repeat protein